MTRNVAASVRQRLLNRARAEGRPFNEALQYFALERLLYRLGRSPFADRFVLKGALMFGVWQGAFFRPTRDVDFLGHVENSVESVVGAFRVVCRQAVPEDDGLQFHADDISGERIAEAAEYEGIRLHVPASLGTARLRLRVDVGFGDVLVPGSSPVRLPTMLDFPAPEVAGYSRESVIAEKLQAMVFLGAVNSRMKDFYDIWFLAGHFPFEGGLLARAIRATFQRRQTALPSEPIALTEAFARDEARQTQWRAFVRRLPTESAPPTLNEAVRVMAVFLVPVIQALNDGQAFDMNWPPGGPWS